MRPAILILILAALWTSCVSARLAPPGAGSVLVTGDSVVVQLPPGRFPKLQLGARRPESDHLWWIAGLGQDADATIIGRVPAILSYDEPIERSLDSWCDWPWWATVCRELLADCGTAGWFTWNGDGPSILIDDRRTVGDLFWLRPSRVVLMSRRLDSAAVTVDTIAVRYAGWPLDRNPPQSGAERDRETWATQLLSAHRRIQFGDHNDFAPEGWIQVGDSMRAFAAEQQSAGIDIYRDLRLDHSDWSIGDSSVARIRVEARSRANMFDNIGTPMPLWVTGVRPGRTEVVAHHLPPPPLVGYAARVNMEARARDRIDPDSLTEVRRSLVVIPRLSRVRVILDNQRPRAGLRLHFRVEAYDQQNVLVPGVPMKVSIGRYPVVARDTGSIDGGAIRRGVDTITARFGEIRGSTAFRVR